MEFLQDTVRYNAMQYDARYDARYDRMILPVKTLRTKFLSACCM
jgi:hypothetical protein